MDRREVVDTISFANELLRILVGSKCFLRGPETGSA